jgi:hypothetical protein
LGIIGDDAFIQRVLAEEKGQDECDNLGDLNITISDLIKHVCSIPNRNYFR